jgi:excisionase family DNA binding protein
VSNYLTVQEVAERMRCEHRTVRRAIRAGHLEAAMIGGRWLIRDGAVDAWVDARAHRANAPSPQTRTSSRPSRTTRPERAGSVARLKAIEGSRG